jgi:hypothetical protein
MHSGLASGRLSLRSAGSAAMAGAMDATNTKTNTGIRCIVVSFTRTDFSSIQARGIHCMEPGIHVSAHRVIPAPSPPCRMRHCLRRRPIAVFGMRNPSPKRESRITLSAGYSWCRPFGYAAESDSELQPYSLTNNALLYVRQRTERPASRPVCSAGSADAENRTSAQRNPPGHCSQG